MRVDDRERAKQFRLRVAISRREHQQPCPLGAPIGDAQVRGPGQPLVEGNGVEKQLVGLAIPADIGETKKRREPKTIEAMQTIFSTTFILRTAKEREKD